MTNRAPQPLRQCQPYGAVRPSDGEVILDVGDAALTRIVELIDRRPHLLATLADAANHRRLSRHAALMELLADPDIRQATTVHLSVEDAVELATEIIAAATPAPSPGRARAVGGRAHDETTDQERKAAR